MAFFNDALRVRFWFAVRHFENKMVGVTAGERACDSYCAFAAVFALSSHSHIGPFEGFILNFLSSIRYQFIRNPSSRAHTLTGSKTLPRPNYTFLWKLILEKFSSLSNLSIQWSVCAENTFCLWKMYLGTQYTAGWKLARKLYLLTIAWEASLRFPAWRHHE